MKMKSMIVTMALGLVMSSQAFAGASNNFIECANADGSVKLVGDVPGDFAEFTLKATVKSKNGGITPSIELYSRTNQQTGQNEANGRVAVVDALEDGVFTVRAESTEGAELIQLFAYPSTVRLKKHGRPRLSQFRAKLTLSSENGMEDVVVRCKTDYSI
jgi:hypothetical protein